MVRLVCVLLLFLFTACQQELAEKVIINGEVEVSGATSQLLYMKDKSDLEDATVTISVFDTLKICSTLKTDQNGRFAFQLPENCVSSVAKGSLLLVEVEKQLKLKDKVQIVSLAKLVLPSELNSTIKLNASEIQSTQLVFKWLYQHTLHNYNRRLLPITPEMPQVMELNRWAKDSLTLLDQLSLKATKCKQHSLTVDLRFINQAHELVYLNCAQDLMMNSKRNLKTVSRSQQKQLLSIQKRLFTSLSGRSILPGFKGHFPKDYVIKDDRSIKLPPMVNFIGNQLDCDNVINGANKPLVYFKDSDRDLKGEHRQLQSCKSPKGYVLNSKDNYITKRIKHSLKSLDDMVTADFNNDGHVDILVASAKSKLLQLFLMENGIVKETLDISTSVSKPNALASADIDGDGDIDYCLGSEQGSRLEWGEQIQSKGDISFKSHLVSTDYPSIVDCEIVDLNKDKKSDLVVVSWEGAKLVVFYQQENGRFEAKELGNLIYKASAVGVADLSQDGELDIVASSYAKGDLTLYLAKDYQSKVVTTPSDRALGLSDLVIADMDNDGWMDIVVSSFFDDKLSVFYQMLGDFSRDVIDTTVDGAKSVAVADFNGDGTLDIASTAIDGQVRVYYQSKRSTRVFRKELVTAGLKIPVALSVADMTNDNRIDILTASKMDNLILWHQNILKNN